MFDSEVIDAQLEMTDRIGYQLLKKGIIDIKILESALKVKNEDDAKLKRNLAQILVTEFNFDHDLVFREVALLYAFKEINLNDADFTEERFKNIKKIFRGYNEDTRNLLLEHKVIPYKYDQKIKGKLILAATDPTDRVLNKIAYALNLKKFEINYIRMADYQRIIKMIFPPADKLSVLLEEDVADIRIEDQTAYPESAVIEDEIKKNSLLDLIEAILAGAVKKGASDIHIVPKNIDITDISYRLNGKLQYWFSQKNTHYESILTVIKQKSAGISNEIRNKLQSGIIERTINGNPIRFFISVIPVAGNDIFVRYESVVIRIQNSDKVYLTPSRIGIDERMESSILQAVSGGNGIIVVNGPRGSGNSNTVAAILNLLNPASRCIVSVRDNVEYMVPGIKYMNGSSGRSRTENFDILRKQDPDIIICGSVSSKEEFEEIKEFSAEGKLVIITMNREDSVSALEELMFLSKDYYPLLYSLRFIISHRVFGKLCDNCKKEISDIEKNNLGKIAGDYFTENETYYTSAGCDICGNSGYSDNVVVQEYLEMTEELRSRLISGAGKPSGKFLYRVAGETGFSELRKNASKFAAQGLISPTDIIINSPDIKLYEQDQ